MGMEICQISFISSRIERIHTLQEGIRGGMLWTAWLNL
jgi:hypothetical protein